MKILGLFRLGILLPVLLLAFLVWQFWLFLSPDPAPLTSGERAAVRAAAETFVAALEEEDSRSLRSVGVVHLSSDPTGEATEILRAEISAAPGLALEKASVPVRFVEDLGRAIGDASTLAEIAAAGREVGIDLLVLGKVDSIGGDAERARAELHLSAYDNRAGEWAINEVVRGTWTPDWAEEVERQVRSWSFWQRLTLWGAFVLLLPWLLGPLVRKVVRRRSNAWSAVLVLGTVALNLLLGSFLLGFRLEGFLPWLGFVGAAVVATAYPWWVYEKLAE